MKPVLLRSILSVITVLSFAVSNAQIVEIVANPGTSATPALGTSLYVANEAIYTETEIGAGNFTTAGTAITEVGFSVGTVGLNTTFNSISIYMKDVPLTTTTFTAGTYTTAGYTLVYSGSATFSATGFTDIPLTTPYTRAAGTNLQVLITRTDAATHGSYIWNCANGNNTSSTISTTRRYNGTVALSGSTNLAVSAFRQAIRLKHVYPNDAGVRVIYTLSKLPVANAATQAISAVITNVGVNAFVNLPVTLDITGANNYTQTEFIPALAPSTSVTVTFPATTFTNTGTNNVVVSVPSDDNATNNSKTLAQLVNANTWSYAYGAVNDGGVGFNGATGDFVAKFNTSAATFLSQVSVNFAAGGQPFKVGVWSADGLGGVPGTLLWESAQVTSTAGVYVLPVAPAVALAAGDFYVGVRQVGTVNVSFAYQIENPIRPSTFYFASPTGSTTWNDFAPANSFRFMIEPKLILATDASLAGLTVGGNTASCSGVLQNISANVFNAGSNPIASGAATVTLKISGANSYTATASNVLPIASGASQLITFSNVNLSNLGTNLDTAYVVLAGDVEQANDTFRTSHQTLATTTAMPIIESFENVPYTFNSVQQLAGTGNWTLQTGSATNAGLSGPLAPHSGTNFIKFDAYNFAAATLSRIYSHCVTIPALAGSPCTTPYLGFWMSHDNSYPANADSLYASVSTDGGATWTRLGGYLRYNILYTLPGWAQETIDLSAYAGQTILIGFEAISKFGNLVSVDDIMIGSRALQNVALANPLSSNINLQLTCTDNDGWSYYANPLLPTENVIAINWDPTNTNANVAAKAAAVPTITIDANAYSNQNTATQKATFTMKRYWNVDLGSTSLTGPVNMRFFYDSAEVAEVNTAVTNFIATYGGTAATPSWFKTSTGAFMPSPTQVTVNGVVPAIPLTNINNTNARINGVAYAQFNGITSFSGGTYVGGVGSIIPLPIVNMSISAKAIGTRNVINWTLDNVSEIDNFLLEKSTDGTQFTDMQKVAVQKAALQKDNAPQLYTVYDETPAYGTNFYRVKMVERSGNSSYSKTVNVMNNGSAIPVSVFPNPAKDVVNVSVHSTKDEVASILLTDNTGKVICNVLSELSKGSSTIALPVKGYARGSYLLKVTIGAESYYNKVFLD